MNNLIWTPGVGIDADAHARLRNHFPRPPTPMGEAWFMGDTRDMFTELLGDLDKAPITRLQEALAEIASGTSCFEPSEEWTSWFHFLLPALVQRSHESYVESIFEHLITAFMALYPDGIMSEPYPGFRDDVLLTLGRAMMDPRCWRGSDIAIGTILRRSNNNPNEVWCWWDASGDFSSAMFFCLKYLPESLIGDWARSALAITSPHWRAQMIVWLVGAHAALHDDSQWPSQFDEYSRPKVSWAWSHCLRPELALATTASGIVYTKYFLPVRARLAFLDVIQSELTGDTYLEWIASIDSVAYLKTELAEIPGMFEKLYMAAR